jgi:anti-sigma B factor antagonist
VNRDDLVFTLEAADGLVRPNGELDLASAPLVHAALEEQAGAHGRVTLDLGGLSFLDSSGLRLVLETMEAARRDGFDFAVLPGGPEIQRLFELAGIADRVPFANGSP